MSKGWMQWDGTERGHPPQQSLTITKMTSVMAGPIKTTQGSKEYTLWNSQELPNQRTPILCLNPIVHFWLPSWFYFPSIRPCLTWTITWYSITNPITSPVLCTLPCKTPFGALWSRLLDSKLSWICRWHTPSRGLAPPLPVPVLWTHQGWLGKAWGPYSSCLSQWSMLRMPPTRRALDHVEDGS